MSDCLQHKHLKKHAEKLAKELMTLPLVRMNSNASGGVQSVTAEECSSHPSKIWDVSAYNFQGPQVPIYKVQIPGHPVKGQTFYTVKLSFHKSFLIMGPVKALTLKGKKLQ